MRGDLGLDARFAVVGVAQRRGITVDSRREHRTERRLVDVHIFLHHLGGATNLVADRLAKAAFDQNLVQTLLDGVGVVEILRANFRRQEFEASLR